MHTFERKEPTIDIVIPTLNRPGELAILLDSIECERTLTTHAHVYWSHKEEMDKFTATWPKSDWLHFHLWPHAGMQYSSSDLYSSHLRNNSADAMIYANDDMEFEEGALKAASREFVTQFPDFDGLLCLLSVAKRSIINGEDKGAIPNRLFVTTDIGMIGKKFASYFPCCQFFCPDYKQYHGADELEIAAKTLGKIFASENARVIHKRTMETTDGTNLYVRRRFVNYDRATYAQRMQLGLIWGLDWALVNPGIHHYG